MKNTIKLNKIESALNRGVQAIYPNREVLEKALKSKKKLKIYTGIDPTGKLHIGHLIILKKLRQFQDLGHQIIVLIGDFTATIGDPTDKMATRKPLSRKQVLKNAKDYKKQIAKILDFKKASVKFLYNEKWNNKLKMEDFLKIASNFTVARLLERDMFQKRIKENKDIHLHEFLYPVFQAYDSVAMDVDMEVGGNDQTFNMLTGRMLMKKIKNKEKFILVMKLLVDPEGKKMGKTEGNMINLDEKSKEIYGKIMSWPDKLINNAFEICTNVLMSEVEKIKNPRDAKARLAKEIVSLIYDKKTAEIAEKEFNRIFKDKELPSKMPVFQIFKGNYQLADLLFDSKLVSSKNEAKRVAEQGGVKISGQVKKDWREKIEIKEEIILQVGKRKFLKLKIK